MKVNPIGVQSYQQLNRQEKQIPSMTQQQTENAENKKVLIQPQNTLTKSAISVKAPQGSYDKYMTDTERQALEMIFERYNNNPRFAENAGSSEQALGQAIDIKV